MVYPTGPTAGRLYTVTEVARRLSVPDATIWNLIYTGRLGSVKIGHLRRIPESAFMTYLVEVGLLPEPGL